MAGFRRRFWTLVVMAYRPDPPRFVIMLIVSTVIRVLPLLAALFVKITITATIDGDKTRATTFAILLGLSAAVAFVGGRITSRIASVMMERATEGYDREIIRLSMDIDGIEHLENPEYLDRLEQLRYQPQQLGQNGIIVTVVVWGFVQFVLLLLLLASVDPILMLLPFFAGTSLFMVRKSQDIFQRAFQESAESRRLADHFFEAATSLTRADEVRTLRFQDEAVRRYRDAWSAADARMREAERQGALLGIAGSLGLVIGYVGALVLVVERGIRGEASPGDVVLTVVVAGQLNQQLSSLLDMFRRLLGALTLIDRFLWLVDHAAGTKRDREPAEVPERIREGIRLVDVSFSYPSTDAAVLHDVTLDLPAGAIVALVGDNGAGKTTLVKLLTGMYTPTSGQILVDGTPLVELDVKRWREHTSAAFQDFAHFELTLQESVGVGDLPAVDDDAAVLKALDRAGGADVPPMLADGLRTELGESFDGGVQLSGGQWQKVALGRAMMRATPLLLVLDEPTASLDPGAEQQLFARYAEQAHRTAAQAGTITVLVSHRFSTVRIADLIVVVDDGRIIERGTHQELVALGGIYAELYELQAAGYR